MRKVMNLSSVLSKLYIAIIVFLVLVTSYHIYFSKKIIPGVVVGSVEVGGLSSDEARKKIQSSVDSLDPTLTLIHGGLSYKFSGEALDLSYDVDKSVSRAFEVGRSGHFVSDIKDKIKGLVKSLSVGAIYNVNDAALSNEFARVRGEINQEPQEASFALEKGELKILPSSDGRKISDQEIYDLVVTSFGGMSFGEKPLPVKDVFAKVKEENLGKVFEGVERTVSKSIKVTSEEKEWDFTPEQLLDLLTFDFEDGSLRVLLDRVKFEPYEDMIAQEVDELPRGKVTEEEEGYVLGFELIKSGREVNRDKLVTDFKRTLFGEGTQVRIVTNEISGPEDPAKYGIYALLGEGTSNYKGSAQARIKNLTLAAGRTSGILVPPGDVFSFNSSVGEISGATGYDSAYIISKGRTILGEGGGVCQTSTTLFRAILNAGLPIVTRYAHSYRVYYYEIDSPVGFDATIYQPSVDLKFRNDTPNYLLVQASWDLNNYTLSYKIYGTPDGREVELTEPVVSNLTPPPEPLYQDDPTLEKGRTKQIDFAAWGANVFFKRTVTREGEILYEDTFRSNYQPWRAVYMVGTKEG